MAPLGIMYLAAYLRRREGVDVRIIDMAPAGLAYVDLGREIQKFQPDLLGISALTYESEGLHRVAAIAKQVLPDLPVIAGGPHPSAYTLTSITKLAAERPDEFSPAFQGWERIIR